MNTQNNIVNFQRTKEVLNELKNYINNKNRNKNVQGEMQLAEQNPIVTDKIEETPLPAIDFNTSLSLSENNEPQVIKTKELLPSEPTIATNQSPTSTPQTYIESSPSKLQIEDNGMPTNLTSAVPTPNPSTIETSQGVIPESMPMGMQQQTNNNKGMVEQPQNITASSINENDSKVISFPTSTTMVQDNRTGSVGEIPQAEIYNVAGLPDLSLNNSHNSDNPEVLSNSNNIETVPQIDINSVMEESPKTEDTNLNQSDTGVYKAATNMGAVAINDTSSINKSGEVTMPTGQEAVLKPSSPIVTEASFNESPEQLKIAS